MPDERLPVSEKNFVFTEWLAHRAEEVTERFLTSGRERPTAIVCGSDDLACVAIRTARRLGFAVPEDLSVVGFSDSHQCTFSDPPLTSVAQPFEAIGQRCGALLIEQIQTGKIPRGRRNPEKLATSLVVRGSTAGA